MSNKIYVLGDGDRVRERVESSLLSGDLRSLADFSEKLVRAISSLAERLAASLDAKIIMAGGDDVLLVIDQGRYDREVLEELSVIFRSETGASISFGVGVTIEDAYVNLRRAKVIGGGIVEGRRDNL